MPRHPYLTDAEWRKIQPLLAVRKAGRRRVDDRTTVAGIVLSLRTGCPWRELPAIYGNPNTLMSRYNRWKKDGTIDRIAAVLRFKPMSDAERHHHQGYGTFQRQQFKRDGFNPWLHTRDEAAIGQEDLLAECARVFGWDQL
jgi:transposase